MRRDRKAAAGPRALPLGLLLLGSLAVFLAAGSSPSPERRSSGGSSAGLAASPAAPAAVVAREGTPVVPGLDSVGAPVRCSVPEAASADPASGDLARRGVLIETRVADKYRPFRESLSLP